MLFAASVGSIIECAMIARKIVVNFVTNAWFIIIIRFICCVKLWVCCVQCNFFVIIIICLGQFFVWVLFLIAYLCIESFVFVLHVTLTLNIWTLGLFGCIWHWICCMSKSFQTHQWNHKPHIDRKFGSPTCSSEQEIKFQFLSFKFVQQNWDKNKRTFTHVHQYTTKLRTQQNIQHLLAKSQAWFFV